MVTISFVQKFNGMKKIARNMVSQTDARYALVGYSAAGKLEEAGNPSVEAVLEAHGYEAKLEPVQELQRARESLEDGQIQFLTEAQLQELQALVTAFVHLVSTERAARFGH